MLNWWLGRRFDCFQFLIGGKTQRCGSLGFIILAEKSRTGNVACLLCLQFFLGCEGCYEDRIEYHVAESLLLIGREGVSYVGCLGLQQVVIIQISLQFVAEFARMEFVFAERHGHVSGRTDAGEPVVFLHERHQFSSHSGAEEPAEPLLIVLFQVGSGGCIPVPSLLHEKGKLVGACLRIVDIGYPGLVFMTAGTVRLVGLAFAGTAVLTVCTEFVEHQSWRKV